jgi:gamma-aminobutyric acid type B receptor
MPTRRVTFALRLISLALLGPLRTRSADLLPSSGQDTPLYLAYLAAYTGAWNGGPQMEPAVFMAFEDINNDPNTLPGYDLRRVTKNGECSATKSVKALFDIMANSSTPLVGVVGPGCSAASKGVAVTASIFNLVTVGGSAGTGELSQKHIYPYYLRTVAPHVAWVPAAVDLFAVYGWTRVAIIAERAGVPLGTANAFADQAPKRGGIRVIVNERLDCKCRLMLRASSPVLLDWVP